jgi:nitrous oxide reductase
MRHARRWLGMAALAALLAGCSGSGGLDRAAPPASVAPTVGSSPMASPPGTLPPPGLRSPTS